MHAGRFVENAEVDALYTRPRHPYTIGLLRSVPRLDRPTADSLTPIEGQPPDALAMPRGCAFPLRCPFAVRLCAVERPTLRPIADGHEVACWVDVDG